MMRPPFIWYIITDERKTQEGRVEEFSLRSLWKREDTVLPQKARENALAGVACGPIQTIDRVFADPQVQRAELVHEQS